jgi:peptidoglycan/LPS O-acetylase OafA/YrhL
VALAGYALLSTGAVGGLVFARGPIAHGLRAAIGVLPLRALGRISYGVYLYHLPILFSLGMNQANLNGGGVPATRIALAVALTMGLAIVSYVVLERPLLRLKARLGARPSPPSPMADNHIAYDASSSRAPG